MRVLVAMSGGVDSSVAAAILRDEGHDVVGVTLRLWGGDSDQGCCSVADVEDARRVARQLGIDHHVFNLSDAFSTHVVEPYVAAHARARTPNPCIECNRHLKFDRLLVRARALGFEAVATGHHARIVTRADGVRRVARGADRAKDQSYVLHVLGQAELADLLLPLGDLTKPAVRARAAELGLATAAKPDSQDVCFITATGGRQAFLGSRIPLHPARVVEARTGREVGSVDALELVTVGQRKGLALAGGGGRRYAVAVEVDAATVVVGDHRDLLVDEVTLTAAGWAADPPPPGARFEAQSSAHGAPVAVRVVALGPDSVRIRFAEAHRRVAPGQHVVLYDGDEVVGGGEVA